MMKIIIYIVVLLIIFYCITAYSTPPFPAIYVINLDGRPERLAEVQQEFKGWPSLERVAAVKRTPGWIGCSLSHLQCIRRAKERQEPWALIIEDDCILTPDAKSRFTALLPHLWAHRNEWDLFNGGLTVISNYTIVDRSRGLFKANGYAANFYLVHSGSYDKILDGYSEVSPAKIDVYYDRLFRIWVTAPYLAGQRVSASDIEETVTDYTDLFKSNEKILTDALLQ